MHALRPLSATRRRLYLALFACALLLRAMVPAGWMPAVQPGGVVALVVCDGMAPAPVAAAMHHAMPAHGGGPHAPDAPEQRPDHPCTFAGLGLALALAEPVAAAPVEPALPARSAVPGSRTAAPAVRLAAPPPPPTGPPVLA